MYLGSDAANLQAEVESRQNTAVLERLLENSMLMQDKIKNIGLPLQVIQEELYGKKGPSLESYSQMMAKKSGSQYKAKTNRQVRNELANLTQLSDRVDFSDVNSDYEHMHSSNIQPKARLNVSKLEEAYATIKQDSNCNSPGLLSPVPRRAFAKRMVAHTMQSTFLVCDYGIDVRDSTDKTTLQNETPIPGGGVDYLPIPRDKTNPHARGGAIAIQPEAPSPRLDSALDIKEMLNESKALSLDDILDIVGIRPLPDRFSGQTQSYKQIPKPIQYSQRRPTPGKGQDHRTSG